MAKDVQGRIDRLLDECSREELLTLIERITQRLRRTGEHEPKPLYGIWKGKFTEGADIDEALGEIRSQWKKEDPGGGSE